MDHTADSRILISDARIRSLETPFGVYGRHISTVKDLSLKYFGFFLSVLENHKVLVMDHTAGNRAVIMETRIRYQEAPFGIYGRQISTATDLSLEYICFF